MKKMPIIWFPVACENKSDIHKEGHFSANTTEESFIYLYTKKDCIINKETNCPM